MRQPSGRAHRAPSDRETCQPRDTAGDEARDVSASPHTSTRMPTYMSALMPALMSALMSALMPIHTCLHTRPLLAPSDHEARQPRDTVGDESAPACYWHVNHYSTCLPRPFGPQCQRCLVPILVSANTPRCQRYLGPTLVGATPQCQHCLVPILFSANAPRCQARQPLDTARDEAM